MEIQRWSTATLSMVLVAISFLFLGGCGPASEGTPSVEASRAAESKINTNRNTMNAPAPSLEQLSFREKDPLTDPPGNTSPWDLSR
jgi:hypothetical protein